MFILSILFVVVSSNAALLLNNEDTSVDSEIGKYFEGDMLLTDKQRDALFEPRNVLIDEDLRWPENTVAYYIEEDDFDEETITKIMNAMEDIANKTCIKFRVSESDNNAVKIQASESGCYSNVGYKPSMTQVINLGSGCYRHGTIVHEILHTLGVYHMQSNYNRDDYVKIVWENIEKGKEHNFKHYDKNVVTDFGEPYDYGSVMHYPDTAFSKNLNKTIIPLKEGVKIGQRAGLSDTDISKLNKMYNCNNKENDALKK